MFLKTFLVIVDSAPKALSQSTEEFTAVLERLFPLLATGPKTGDELELESHSMGLWEGAPNPNKRSCSYGHNGHIVMQD